jgi:hypothetical protein
MTFGGVQPCPPIRMFLRHHRAPQYAQKVGHSLVLATIFVSTGIAQSRRSTLEVLFQARLIWLPSRELGISSMEGS